MKVIIMTGSELRHSFMRKSIALDPDIEVLKTFCERTEANLTRVIDEADPNSKFQHEHIKARAQSEYDFFNHFVALTPDESNPVFIPKGDINNDEHVKEIINLKPDLLVAYGCSIIKKPLLEAFPNKILNVHLGLSPYYRGAGTNFWPMVNKEPEFVGATFMYMDEGVDTGDIIHQMRAKVFKGDNHHQIGNRLIADIAGVYIKVINNIDNIKTMKELPEPAEVHYCRTKDFSPESVISLYKNFEEGLVDSYLAEIDERLKNAPIIKNPLIEED